MPGRRGEYGFDAPYVVAGLAALSAAEAVAFGWAASRRRPLIAAITGLGVAWGVAATANYVYSTRRGKFVVWERLLDELRLQGDERVLDVGCGRGAVLTLAAERTPRGETVGVDVWRARDQFGNARAVAERNARLEGVSDRVRVVDGDARSLPFPDDSFDVVVSSLAVHNISPVSERERALGEMARVLRPGGELRVVDLGAAGYLPVLRTAGVYADLRPLGWRMWFGSPFTRVAVVSGRRQTGRVDHG